MNYLLVALAFLFCCEAATLLNLIDAKYGPEIAENDIFAFHGVRTLPDGSQVAHRIPRPPTPNQKKSLDREIRAKLATFEVYPSPVLEDKDLWGMILHEPIREYFTSQVARDIFEMCLSRNNRIYLIQALNSCVLTGNEVLANRLIDDYIEFYRENLGFYEIRELAWRCATAGNFAIPLRLMENGIPNSDYYMFAQRFCEMAPLNRAADVFNFLEQLSTNDDTRALMNEYFRIFLQRQMIALNEQLEQFSNTQEQITS